LLSLPLRLPRRVYGSQTGISDGFHAQEAGVHGADMRCGRLLADLPLHEFLDAHSHTTLLLK